ncbi:ArsB/NhaD family transporter [Lentisphaerota bacterium WC36G]|nr:ArsB/NhaD family transporter [Lentisphaerae bacterium WC36]
MSVYLFWFATIVFFGTYIAIATEKFHKTTVALAGAMMMFFVILEGPSHSEIDHSKPTITEVISQSVMGKEYHNQVSNVIEKAETYDRLNGFSRYVDFDVIFTLAGMMLLVNILSGTGVFQYIAIKCAKYSRGSPIRTMILLVLATAILSAFLDNVTTVLLIAPVTLLVAAELDVNPIPFLMAETMSSNIGGSATLIGDPPNLIIGSYAGLNFSQFLINLSPFIIIVLIIYCIALYLHYGKKMEVNVEKRARIMELDENAAITDVDNMRRGGAVMIITIIGFLLHGALHLQPSVVAMGGATLALVICKIDVDHQLEKIEWSTLFFFMGLFIVVNGAQQAGLMDEFGKLLAFTKSWHPLLTILVVMWVSGIAAAVTNNVSFTAAIVSVIGAFLAAQDNIMFTGNTDLKELMWWGLALAVCLGGNGTIVGAAANLVTAGVAEKSGIKITFKEFLRYGVPVTLGSLVLASIYIVARFYVEIKI